MTVHISGMCKVNGCDRGQAIEGYCTYHYNLYKEQKTNLILSELVNIMGNVYNRLGQIENKLDNHQPTQVIQQIIPETKTQSSISSLNIKQKEETPIKQFIPTIEIPDIESNLTIKTQSEVKRNLQEIAKQLKNI